MWHPQITLAGTEQDWNELRNVLDKSQNMDLKSGSTLLIQSSSSSAKQNVGNDDRLLEINVSVQQRFRSGCYDWLGKCIVTVL